jgi:hypothetical protein
MEEPTLFSKTINQIQSFDPPHFTPVLQKMSTSQNLPLTVNIQNIVTCPGFRDE